MTTLTKLVDHRASAVDEVAELPASEGLDLLGRRRSVVVGGAVLAFVLVAAGSVRSYRDLSASRSRIEELEQEISSTRNRIDQLGIRIDALEDDPVAIEWLAREELGLARPGEVILALSEELR